MRVTRMHSNSDRFPTLHRLKARNVFPLGRSLYAGLDVRSSSNLTPLEL
jgi:hypothetical protein